MEKEKKLAKKLAKKLEEGKITINEARVKSGLPPLTVDGDEKITKDEGIKMEIEKKVLEFIKKQGWCELKTTDKDAQAILDILEMIKERGYSVAHASAILDDVSKLLPMLAKL